MVPDDAADHRFGYDLVISELVILVGALYDDDNDSNSGSVHIFDTSGEFIWKQVDPDSAKDNNLG